MTGLWVVPKRTSDKTNSVASVGNFKRSAVLFGPDIILGPAARDFFFFLECGTR